MKCPKCGFVSFPGLEHCKKCGYRLASAPPPGPESSVLSLFPGSSVPPAGAAASTATPPPTTEGGAAVPERQAEPAPSEGSPTGDVEPVLAEAATAAEPARPWREELSERVEDFRRRRARLRGGFDPNTSLDLEFGGPADSEIREPAEAEVLEFQRGVSEPGIPAAGLSSLDREMPVLDSVPLEKQGGEKWMPTPTPVEAGELPLSSEAAPPAPFEIILEASRPGAQEAFPEASPLVFPLAPLGRRFVAGLIDALILSLAGNLFGLILWRAGVHVAPRPLNLIVLGCIVVFFLLVYFGLFTALASSTPGLLWMGIEVRNLDGAFPSWREAFWRAVGYLVSISALMMGFIWALVDSEGLTWHDRISGTFLTLVQSAGEGQTSEVESMNF